MTLNCKPKTRLTIIMFDKIQLTPIRAPRSEFRSENVKHFYGNLHFLGISIFIANLRLVVRSNQGGSRQPRHGIFSTPPPEDPGLESEALFTCCRRGIHVYLPEVLFPGPFSTDSESHFRNFQSISRADHGGPRQSNHANFPRPP